MSSSQSTKKARRSAGVCVDCGSGTYLGSTRCGRCRNKDGIYQKRMTSRRVADGLCPCGRARPTVGRSCIDCWFYDIVRRRTGTAQHVGAMRKLWELQQGKCAYLGVALVPGGNASIDHMTPPSRGGTHAPENLQWVDERINRMKTDMTHEEFLAACESILTRHA
jgi:hypothetical protein